VFILLAAVVTIGGAILLSNSLGDTDDTIPVAEPSTPTTGDSSTPTSESSVTTAGSTTTQPTTTTEASATTTTTTPTTTTEATTTTTTQPEREPSEVTVLVLNSTTRSGLAAAVTADLAALGYQMLEQDNYRPTLDVSAVWFAPGFEREADTLAVQIPDAVVEPFAGDDVLADIVVILGASFSG
jgi:hypothetical protein